MLSFLAQRTPRTNTATLNPITYEDGRASQHFFDPTAKYMMRDTIPATTPTHGRSMFNPPMHYHISQTEEFHIVSGTARFFVDGHTYLRSADEIQFIPRGAFHCFENASAAHTANNGEAEDLIVEFRLDAQKWEMEEKFFRNFFGYLDDCRKADQSPSVCQLFRFVYDVDAALVLGVPGPKWVKRQVSWWTMVVLGVVVGEWVLGYKGSYEEYYVGEEKKEK